MDVVIWSGTPDRDTKYIFRYMGAYKISYFVRKYGYSSQVIDFINFMSEEQLYDASTKFITQDTNILAISSTFLCQLTYIWPDRRYARFPYHVFLVLERIKKEYPNIKIILGGHLAHSIGSYGLVDASVIEYGEDIFLELLEHYKLGKDEPEFIVARSDRSSDVRKMYNKSKTIRFNIQTDAHLFLEQDCIISGETLPIEISRGCVFKCKFCNHLLLGRGKLDYLRSFECVKEEMLHNYNKWKITNYFIICDTFNDTPIKMKQWYDMVMALPFKINYTAYLRADLLHRYSDTPIILKDTGLYSTFHGIESLGAEASKIIGKAWSGKHAREWIPMLYHDIWEGKIKQHLSFIIGLPNDTRESIIDTVNWCVDNNLYSYQFEILGLYNRAGLGKDKSSEFEKNAESYGYSFPDSRYLDLWKSFYWNKNEAIEFRKSIIHPIIQNNSSWFNSWDNLSLMTFNVNENLFDKFWQKTQSYDNVINMINNMSTDFMTDYINRLNEI